MPHIQRVSVCAYVCVCINLNVCLGFPKFHGSSNDVSLIRENLLLEHHIAFSLNLHHIQARHWVPPSLFLLFAKQYIDYDKVTTRVEMLSDVLSAERVRFKEDAPRRNRKTFTIAAAAAATAAATATAAAMIPRIVRSWRWARVSREHVRI